MHASVRQRLARLTLLVMAGLLLAGWLPALAASKTDNKSSSHEVTAPPDISSSFNQSYNADASVQVGMIVTLKAKDPSTVVPLKSDQIKQMLGVVIPTGDAAVTLTPTKVTQQQVLVATSGRASVVVSNQGGPIEAGDYVTISGVSGVGMKAGEDEEEIVGKAAGNFSGTANVIGSVKLKDTTGHESTVSLGRVPVDIAISHNPLFQKQADFVPGFLAKAAATVSHHAVSAARIYLSLAVLMIAAFVTANMLYSGVRSGMLAVGRNPLSRKSIIRSLIQTVIAGLIVFTAGIFAVYLLLKL
jgi:hypothetical protein